MQHRLAAATAPARAAQRRQPSTAELLRARSGRPATTGELRRAIVPSCHRGDERRRAAAPAGALKHMLRLGALPGLPEAGFTSWDSHTLTR
jgi:hypothetical protein